jgi:hypothetical protein
MDETLAEVQAARKKALEAYAAALVAEDRQSHIDGTGLQWASVVVINDLREVAELGSEPEPEPEPVPAVVEEKKAKKAQTDSTKGASVSEA